jgi:hypothetical protein
MLKVVDLPAPLGPIRASSSPDLREKPTSSTARLPPKFFVRPWTVRRLMR